VHDFRVKGCTVVVNRTRERLLRRRVLIVLPDILVNNHVKPSDFPIGITSGTYGNIVYLRIILFLKLCRTWYPYTAVPVGHKSFD